MSNLPPPWRPITEKEGAEFLGFVIFLHLLPYILIALIIMGVIMGVVGVIKETVNLFGTNVNIGSLGYCPPNKGSAAILSCWTRTTSTSLRWSSS